MPRPLRGSLGERDGAWDASVPRRRGEKARVHATFSTQKQAQKWIDAQVERLMGGRESEPPEPGTRGYLPSPARSGQPPERSSPRPAPVVPDPPAVEWGPNFAEMAERMCRERYEIVRSGNPDTAASVRSIIRNHLLQIFSRSHPRRRGGGKMPGARVDPRPGRPAAAA